ncbi:MAG TPA: hypothetical protein VKE98_20915 [Gemmataceae bacterium]|nr:hypothetical protein [Gemmataceae bacterium]
MSVCILTREKDFLMSRYRIPQSAVLFSAFILGGVMLCFRPATKVAATEPEKGVDLYGDPLPKGAVARLGSVRFHHPGGVNAMAFTPDGKSIAAVGYEDKGPACRIWDVGTGKQLMHFGLDRKSTLGATCTGFALNGKVVAFGRGEAIELYDRFTGKLIRAFEKHNNNSFAISVDGAQDRLYLLRVGVHGVLSGCVTLSCDARDRFVS